MKKKLIAFMLALSLCLGFVPVVSFAASDEARKAADTLHGLGLFQGVGTSPDGTPIYELDRAPLRSEAITMFVRLLGKEEEAKAGEWDIPFTDVPTWARPYVGYAYANGLTQGTGTTTFGSNDPADATQYITFALRSLGYESGKDFQWNTAWELSDKLGITDGRYNADTNKNFTRGDVAIVSLATHELQEMMADDELARAWSYGLIPVALRSDYDREATLGELCALLDQMLTVIGATEEEVAQWRAVSAQARTDDALRRELAMLGVYEAAVVLGYGDIPNGAFLQLNGELNEIGLLWIKELTRNYPQWPNWADIAPFSGTDDPTSYLDASIHFAQGQYSGINGRRVFDFDWENMSMHTLDTMTRKDMIVSVSRFYESLGYGYRTDEAAIARILSEANERRAEILNTPTTIVKSDKFIPGETYTGRAFYISSSEGDDKNPGTIDKPWKTANRSIWNWEAGEVSAGDAVFFKRGDVWRGESLHCLPGVTYSAYGEGAKPRFYGSAEDGMGEDKWTLAYSDDTGTKIWEFYTDMPDVGGVIFNDGESWAERIYGRWTRDGEFVDYNDPSVLFDFREQLSRDLTCCSVIDYSGLPYPILEAYSGDLRGKLYLRCDEGNPGTLYSAVEFEATDAGGWSGVIWCALADGCVIDNLSTRFYGNCGIQCSPEASGVVIQNCELAWGGNHVHQYADDIVWYTGDGIYSAGNNSVIRNNYCHDIDGAGVGFEPGFEGEDPSMGTITFDGPMTVVDNLIEHCGLGVRVYTGLAVGDIPEIIVKRNTILYTGEGYVHGASVNMSGLHFWGRLIQFSLNVTENTLYRAVDDALLWMNEPIDVDGIYDNSFYR